MWSLPTEVRVGDSVYHIREKCDYRVVLDVIETLTDPDYDDGMKSLVSLLQFYEELTLENINSCPHLQLLAEEMSTVISAGRKDTNGKSPALMDWAHDECVLAPAISRVLGYSVRDPSKYTHWYDYIGAYQEIGGDCTFAEIVRIRYKKLHGKKLDKAEMEFFRDNRDQIVIPAKMTAEELAFVNEINGIRD